MRRRTMLRRIGTATGAAAVLGSGSATAEPVGTFDPAALGVERPVDVSDRSGPVALGELLTDEELANLPAGVTADDQLAIAPGAGTIQFSSDCCEINCDVPNEDEPSCDCYVCE